jgi:hypothetical protein
MPSSAEGQLTASSGRGSISASLVSSYAIRPPNNRLERAGGRSARSLGVKEAA